MPETCFPVLVGYNVFMILDIPRSSSHYKFMIKNVQLSLYKNAHGFKLYYCIELPWIYYWNNVNFWRNLGFMFVFMLAFPHFFGSVTIIPPAWNILESSVLQHAGQRLNCMSFPCEGLNYEICSLAQWSLNLNDEIPNLEHRAWMASCILPKWIHSKPFCN